MSFRDQQKYLDELKKYERMFDKKETEEFKLFIKRQKDEEDFDTISLKRLKELYNKYTANKEPKKNYDAFFKKKDD